MNFHIKGFLLVILTVFSLKSFSQTDYHVFNYPNGQIASEGTLKDGKPDGYWKTYYENGQLKSEGNRVNFLLEGTWRFFSEAGDTTLVVNYSKGTKQGIRYTYSETEVLEEPFVKDIRMGEGGLYDKRHRLIQTIQYKNGFEEGLSPVFDTTGTLQEIITYRKGFIIKREVLNRYDKEGKRHGYWKTFYDDWSLHTECYYRHGLRDGFYKEYDKNGNLKKITKYANDIEQIQESDLKPLIVQHEYHPNGQVKREVSFRDGKREGIWREFDENGNVLRSQTYKKGALLSEGVVGTDGKRRGEYKEFYADSTLRAEGEYLNGEKTGEWRYYYQNGQLEEKGMFKEGKQDGIWIWYYDNGKIQIEEMFFKGIANGAYKEYDTEGKLIVSGTYFDGMKAGKWMEEIGDMYEEGEYRNDQKVGEWTSFYDNGKTAFKGSYNGGYPNGLHHFYYPNGKLREVQSFAGGVHHGEWKKYNEDGALYFTITYNQGIEIKYDGDSLNEDEIVRD